MSLRFKNRSRKLRIEQFEARQMMAGDFGAAGGIVAGEVVQADTAPKSIPVVQELNLNSLPGAAATLFLDFNGHFQQESFIDTLDIGGYTNILTPAYSSDNDPNTFSPFEQDEIRSLWALVAEDYAPFNINVTTVDPDPGNLHPERPYLRVVISGASDFTGNNLGGVSEKDWDGSFDSYSDPDDPNIVYVFQKNSSGGLIGLRHMAEAASHEAAHAFGVDHYHSESNGNPTRAAIMEDDGATQAIRGVWADDDMQIIGDSNNGFGWRADDHNDSIGGAHGMTTTSAGLFASGLINWHTDTDMFRFETGGGEVTIDLDLPTVSFLGGVGNLDAKLSLYSANGSLITTVDDPAKLDATIKTNLAAGTYYIGVSSHGIYGDVGKYSLLVTEGTGAHIVSSSFQTFSNGTIGMTVTFNEAINLLTFSTIDVQVNGAAPGVGVISVQPVANSKKQFLITLAASSTSMPSVSIGPNINDLFGNRMDQNKNGINGEAADYYFAQYLKSINTSGTLTTTPSTTKPKVTSFAAVDAYFARI